jgi:hypothetical protein
VECGGLAELHAAFLKESRTRSRRMDSLTGNSGISPSFGEMWEISRTSINPFPLRKQPALSTETQTALANKPTPKPGK